MSHDKLINRLMNGECSNELDVKIEIALFKPSKKWASVTANNAGTKVVYTSKSGDQETFWAQDWSRNPQSTIDKIKAIT